MIKIETENIKPHKTWEEMIKAFINYTPLENYPEDILIKVKKSNDLVSVLFISESVNIKKTREISPLDEVRITKVLIYEIFSELFKKELPWGTLTGIRPVSFLNWTKSEFGDELGLKIFKDLYHVREDKIRLSMEVNAYERNIINDFLDNYLLYIHIPFCQTRCNYCSFSVMTMDKFGKWMEKYVDGLIYEIENSYDVLDTNKAKSLYIGGGTPSTLSLYNTDRILKTINDLYPNINEITFEAGRPESITDDLMEVLEKNKVTRISINPQSMHQNTLDLIGRKHKVEDIYKAFDIANKYDIDVNTDMIIGFKNESIDDVIYTLESLINLNPANITVHSLALKTGSRLINSNPKFSYREVINREKIYKILNDNSYHPYYLYRQKRQVGEAENVGFSKLDKDNVFNVISMNDSSHVLAFGMGAVTKFVDKNLDCHRVFGYRDVIYYLEHLDELCELKRETVEKYINICN